MKKVKKSYLMLIVSSVVAFSILLNVKLASASEVTQLSDGFKVQLIDKKQHNISNVYNPAVPVLDNLVAPIVRGANKPTKNWNVKTQGVYNMQASWGGGNNLYSNYNVTGDVYYPYYFINQGLHDMVVYLKNSSNNSVLYSFTLEKGTSLRYLLSTSSSSSRFYFQFYSSGDYVFSGYVTHG